MSTQSEVFDGPHGQTIRVADPLIAARDKATYLERKHALVPTIRHNSDGCKTVSGWRHGVEASVDVTYAQLESEASLTLTLSQLIRRRVPLIGSLSQLDLIPRRSEASKPRPPKDSA